MFIFSDLPLPGDEFVLIVSPPDARKLPLLSLFFPPKKPTKIPFFFFDKAFVFRVAVTADVLLPPWPSAAGRAG